MPLLRAITGSETFAAGSASMIVMVHPTTRFVMPMSKGKFISEAAKDGNHVTPVQRAIYLPASITGVRDQGCYWDGSYNVPEGLILRIFASRRQRNTASNRLECDDKAVVFIRVREDGPLQRLQLQRIDHHQSTNAPVYVEGRFDVLSLRDVAAAGGTVLPVDLPAARPAAVQAVLQRVEVAAARRAAGKVKMETVRTDDGQAVRVVTTRTKRATNLG